MSFAKMGILVIDDNKDDGQCIAEILWRNGWQVLFVQYSEEDLLNGIYGKHHGIRTVFLDINLTGDGMEGAGAHLFTPAEQTIKTLLDDMNGPWGLVTWSTHDNKAQELYEHLRNRLPEGLKPVTFARMDKNDLLTGDGQEEKIKGKVLENLERISTLHCLATWEGLIQKASSSVLHQLGKVAESMESHNDFEKNLGCLLWCLAQAEQGKQLKSDDDISSPMYSVLSGLLKDRLGHANSGKCVIDAAVDCRCIVSGDAEDELASWKRQVNGMLHFDPFQHDKTGPGCLFPYPVGTEQKVLPHITNEKYVGKCIRGNFLDFEEGVAGYDSKKDISNGCKLILLDITPPCDHSNNKVIWRRFVVCCHVPVKHKEHLYRIDRKKKKRITGELKGDYVFLSPELSNGDDEFVLAVNANMQVSIPEKQVADNLGKGVGRIREQLFMEIMRWLAAHGTRGGLVTL